MSSQHGFLWGKSKGLESPYPLACHLLDTSAAADVICEDVLPRGLIRAICGSDDLAIEAWRRSVMLLAAWHDVGKASCGFQKMDRKAQAPFVKADDALKVRHEQASAWLLWDHLKGVDLETRALLAQIVGGHHGIIPNLDRRTLHVGGGTSLVDRRETPEMKDARQEIFNLIESTVGTLPADTTWKMPQASAALGVVILADWIVSQTGFIQEQQEHDFEAHAHYLRARAAARSQIDSIGLAKPSYKRPVLNPDSVIGGSAAAWRPFQESLASRFRPAAPGITIISAPTGSGKTEAAVIAAAKYASIGGEHVDSGIFFAMPTRATADGLVDRLENCVAAMTGDPAQVRRVFAHADLLYAPEGDSAGDRQVSSDTVEAVSWMRGTKRTILAPWGIGTIDQLLLGAITAKHAPLRLLGAASKTVVIDEAHAMDVYMWKLALRSIQWLAAYGTSVIVMSATLPHRRITEAIDAYREGAGISCADSDIESKTSGLGYPCWVSLTGDGQIVSDSTAAERSWTLHVSRNACAPETLTEDIAQAVLDATSGGGNALVVRSTINAAQETFDALRTLAPDLVENDGITLLHSRLPHAERSQRTAALLRRYGPDRAARPNRSVVVATQIVEQSMDVDFDILISDPAPIPQILQRCGRVHRHSVGGRPAHLAKARALIAWPQKDGKPNLASYIYSAAELRAADRWLERNDIELRVPEEVPEIIQQFDVRDGEFSSGPQDVDAPFDEITLSHLVDLDVQAMHANRWQIPQPRESVRSFHQITGAQHDHADHTAFQGTRLGSHSEIIIPVDAACEMVTTGGLNLDLPDKTWPPRSLVKDIYNEAIPYSYPGTWSEHLERLNDAWNGTPLHNAILLPLTDGCASITDNDDRQWHIELHKHKGLCVQRVLSDTNGYF